MAFYIKQNDTSPAIRSILEDGDGFPVDLTNSTVRFHMRNAQSGDIQVDALASIVSEPGGIVQYPWQDGDTNLTGWFKAEWQVNYNGDNGDIETFPSEGYIWVKVEGEIS